MPGPPSPPGIRISRLGGVQGATVLGTGPTAATPHLRPLSFEKDRNREILWRLGIENTPPGWPLLPSSSSPRPTAPRQLRRRTGSIGRLTFEAPPCGDTPAGPVRGEGGWRASGLSQQNEDGQPIGYAALFSGSALASLYFSEAAAELSGSPPIHARFVVARVPPRGPAARLPEGSTSRPGV